MNSKVEEVTRRIIKRSESSRTRYLEQVKKDHEYCKGKPVRHCLPCSNLAHAMASASKEEKTGLFKDAPNIGIITAYNDMLSAHCPYAGYPEIIK
ncbi:MAG TPA: phosphogluconate dehydratase, partial [Deltaproteobacteria bacterium]|nr:phosphogluconate dehydratase [Deltaproteobacteria bacterium]